MITSGTSGETSGPETTGRFVVTFADDVGTGGHLAALQAAGMSTVAASTDFAGSAVDADQTRDADAVVFSGLGVAVVAAEPGQVATMQSADEPRILSVEPERVHHALSDTITDAYAAGFMHGAADLAARLAAASAAAAVAPPLAEAAAMFRDDDRFTWGLQAVCATTSPLTGRDVPVCVLDTGFDLTHPDFAGRNPTTRSFVAGQDVQDGHGHGTHCIGTSCGPRSPIGSRRYGVASEARILAGKVLNNEGKGVDGEILSGIEWALAQGSRIVSMSLGAPVPQVSPAYENVGRRALAAGTLIIAAAGNESRRPGKIAPVGIPANSPSIMAVASLDPDLGISFFSCGSNPVRGGQVDIAGPGRDVYSSWPMPKRYHTISGTSMATPHVSGVAALWSQATGHTGRTLWSDLVTHSRRLPLPSTDVGAGLVQGPPSP